MKQIFRKQVNTHNHLNCRSPDQPVMIHHAFSNESLCLFTLILDSQSHLHLTPVCVFLQFIIHKHFHYCNDNDSQMLFIYMST